MDALHSKHGEVVPRGTPAAAGAMKYTHSALILCLSVLLLLVSMPGFAVEHPGILHKDDNCSSCHPEQTSGKSVHSAMALSCTVCHLAQTQGDMTTLQLAAPKEAICFGCHEKSMLLRSHSPAVKESCVDCHDAHSSNRRMLLRELTYTRHHNSAALRSRMASAARKTTEKH
jgi:predicted CXXCH cytochrome family protein